MRKTKVISIGFIGAGYMADHHLKVLTAIKSVDVTSICSRTIDSASKMSKKWGIERVFKDHVQMIESAAELGDVMVIVNSDDWLLRKKGYVFMPWEEKAYIMSQFKGVVKVVSVDDSDPENLTQTSYDTYNVDTSGGTSAAGFVAFGSLSETVVKNWIADELSKSNTKTNAEAWINSVKNPAPPTNVSKALPF